jgi:hypothetical protein
MILTIVAVAVAVPLQLFIGAVAIVHQWWILMPTHRTIVFHQPPFFNAVFMESMTATVFNNN